MSKHENITEKFWKALDDSPFVMLGLSGVDQAHTQPMTAQIDKNLNDCLYFFTNKQNRLVQSLSDSHSGVINFSAKNHSLFACVHGSMKVDNDQAIIDKFWSPVVGAWYEGGKDDPNLCMLRFDLDSAEIWDASAINFMKAMVAGFFGDGADEETTDDVVSIKF